MTPEGPSPQTQAGSDKFIEGVHPTDGVRPFNEAKGELADPIIHESLLERGVPDVSPIDPHTLEVPVDKIPVETKRFGKKSIAAVTAGIIGTAALGLGIALKSSNGDEGERTVSPRPSASAGVEPGQPKPTSPESVQPETAGVGVAGTTLDTLNVRPSEALWQEALRPVMVSEFPTPESAMEHFEDLINIRNVSAEIDSSGDLTESVASITRRAELDSVLFENGTPPNYDDPNKLREIIGIEFWFLNEGGGGVQGEIPTWRSHWTIDSVSPVGENEYLIDYSATVETNFHELDPSAGNRIIGIETINELVETDSLTLENVDGQWFIKK